MPGPGTTPFGRAVLVSLALVMAACGAGGGTTDDAVPPPDRGEVAPSSPATAPDTSRCRAAPLEVRAATVLAVGIGNATAADDPLAVEVSELGLGGVILLGPNIVDRTQTRALLDGLRQRSPRRLLVSVDEEGGRVSRLRSIIGPTPSARTLGQRSLDEIAAVAGERGAVLHELGFDLILAPVVDADGGAAGGAIGDRSFAVTPGEAGMRAGAFANGLRRAGVLPTAKHFPGQGQLADSHDGPVVDDVALEDLESAARSGFVPALDAGVPAVMLSHVTFPALGPLPASLEPGAYRLLRSLGFDGVAVTDAINMSAVVGEWSLTEASVMALVAGADLVLATPGHEAAALRDALVAAVGDGRLPEARLDEAVGRVLALRGEDPASMVCR